METPYRASRWDYVIAEAVEEYFTAARKRDEVILKAHEAGRSIRAIAKVAGLSPARVHQILHGR